MGHCRTACGQASGHREDIRLQLIRKILACRMVTGVEKTPLAICSLAVNDTSDASLRAEHDMTCEYTYQQPNTETVLRAQRRQAKA